MVRRQEVEVDLLYEQRDRESQRDPLVQKLRNQNKIGSDSVLLCHWDFSEQLDFLGEHLRLLMGNANDAPKVQ